MSPGALITIFFPVYFVIFVGVLFSRLRLASVSNISGASNFVFWVSIPSLVFSSLSKSELPDFDALKLVSTYFMAAIAIFLLAFVASKYLDLKSADKTIFSMGSNYSNTILLGLPIISQVMGDDGVLTLFWIVILHAAILFTLAVISLEFASVETEGSIFRRLFRSVTQNPVAISSFLGFLFSIQSAQLPAYVEDSLQLVGAASIPLGLFLIGTSLGSCGRIVLAKQAFLSSVLKVVALPLAVGLLGGYVFQFPHDWVLASVLTAGLPAGASVVIFAQQLNTTAGFASSIFFVSTTLSMITIPGLVYLFS